jgi:hypothetical protein
MRESEKHQGFQESLMGIMLTSRLNYLFFLAIYGQSPYGEYIISRVHRNGDILSGMKGFVRN